MKTIKYNSHFLLVTILLSVVLIGCNKEWDAPEFQVPVYNGPQPNHTIQDIKNKHLVLDSYILDSICSYDEEFIVDGVVISTDEGGNFYKSIVIQDETGAIEIQMDMNGLFNFYPLGQRVIIDCRGLVVGDYNRYYQIGWIYQKYSIGRLNSIAFNKYIHKDGLPSLENVPAPVLGTQIDFNSLNDVGKLVKLENCQFDQASWGKPFSYNEYVTEHTLNISGVATPVVVRTSNYARFRSLKVPSSVGTIYGILTVYNDTYQLMIRNRADIQFEGIDEPSEEIVKEFVFDNNSIGTGGWSINDTTSATPWRFVSYMGEEFMNHTFNHSNIAMDDWLISPIIDVTTTTDSYIRLFHKMDFSGLQDYYRIYYTTDVDAPFNADNYQPLPIITMFTSAYGNSNDIAISSINSNRFKIAIRYNNDGGNWSESWYIKSLSIIKK